MSFKARVEAARAMRKARAKPAPTKLVPRPAGTPKENPLLGISRDLTSRMPAGKEAIIARQAIIQWKGSQALQNRYPSVADYFDVLSELAAAGKIQIREAFTMSERLDGQDLGMDLYRKWEAAGKPGTFTDFIKAEKEKEENERREAKASGGTR
jgi:hypothetical protein